MNKFLYNHAWWRPTDPEIIPLLSHLWMLEAGTHNFDNGFFEAVKCGRIVPALPPKNGEMIQEFA